MERALEGWSPGPVEIAGLIDRWPVDAFAALLDQPPPGELLPPLWHVFHLLDHPAQAELGDDGHPADGHFLPPLPERRRMFAGGRLLVHRPLRIGARVTRRSSLVSATPKTGRSGPMVFVTLRHEFVQDGALAVVEEQDFAYRSQRAGAPRGITHAAPAGEWPGTGSPSTGLPSTGPGGWRLELRPEAAMLFRVSALTYNTHRIHYDHPYVTGVEGYPGLVVHGPLLALLLLELPRRFAPDRTVAAFDYRLRRPAFAGAPLLARRTADGDLVAGVVGEQPSVTGTVTCR